MVLKLLHKLVDEEWISDALLLDFFSLKRKYKFNNKEEEARFIFNYLKNMRQKNDRVAIFALNLLDLHKNIGIYSYDYALYNVLKRNYKCLKDKIFYTISSDYEKGEILIIDLLREMGYRVIEHDNLDFFSNVRKYDAVIIGARLICSRGIASRRGAYLGAKICYKFKIPVYVFAHSGWIITSIRFKQVRQQIILDKYFHLYDFIPLRYITYIITDRRLYTSKDLAHYLSTN